MTITFKQKLTALSQVEHISSLKGIGRGIERETLRVNPDGKLSQQDHPKALGSALTNPQITTDYAETLLEFITPVSKSVSQAIAQLQDIHKFTLSNIDNELFWPMSMPCFVEDEDNIKLAQYGSSNIGTMKTVYRQGLKNRYGSMMQVISGIHFNFSFSEEFWQSLQQITDNQLSAQDFKSQGYFALIRNYKRVGWLIPYLYGSSPTICSSFLQGKENNLPFKEANNGAMYLEHATSLRMSDLGYTNSAQSALQITYNSLEGYVKDVRNAIGLQSQEFEQIGVKVNGSYQQLNSNVLQIENELYAPIRAKRVTDSGEKPSDALANRGVEYIEVRALDINPFVETGISAEQIYFLDVFLTYCALADSPELEYCAQTICDNNANKIINEGRRPGLLLNDSGTEKSVKTWGTELFEDFAQVASLLDKAYQTSRYSEAVAKELIKINDADKTPSAQIIKQINESNLNLSKMALKQAQQYKEQALARDYQEFSEQHFVAQAQQSHANQEHIEQQDNVSFDEFLANYFAS